MNLTKEDYINILNYYNIKINSSTSLTSIKKMAEKIIAKKLCSCIKKVPNTSKKKVVLLEYVIIVCYNANI